MNKIHKDENMLKYYQNIFLNFYIFKELNDYSTYFNIIPNIILYLNKFYKVVIISKIMEMFITHILPALNAILIQSNFAYTNKKIDNNTNEIKEMKTEMKTMNEKIDNNTNEIKELRTEIKNFKTEIYEKMDNNMEIIMMQFQLLYNQRNDNNV